jgi:hypothetical protein
MIDEIPGLNIKWANTATVPPTVKAQANKTDTEGVARAYYAGVRDL